jgi:cyclopropane fatty-acyl-phospholipid synthase-like methyltransferase
VTDFSGGDVMPESIDRAAFEGMYAGKAPWDVGKPQAPLVAKAELIKGPLLDAGCGSGDAAIFFAKRGMQVVGLDFVPAAIDRAKAKAKEQGVDVEFLVKDALSLIEWDRCFASAIDSGLFHVFSDVDRRRYVQGLARVLEKNGRLFLMCFSDREPGEQGPRRISRQMLVEAFSGGWTIESIESVRFETNPEFTAFTFSEGGPKSWFAIIRRS